MQKREPRLRLQDNPKLRQIVENIPIKIAENQPELTTGLRIGDLGKEAKFATRIIFHLCRTIIFARNLNYVLENELKMIMTPVDGQ